MLTSDTWKLTTVSDIGIPSWPVTDRTAEEEVHRGTSAVCQGLPRREYLTTVEKYTETDCFPMLAGESQSYTGDRTPVYGSDAQNRASFRKGCERFCR